jgi:hypothetical protein
MNPITRLTFLSFYLNSLLDQELKLDYRETIEQIEKRSIFDWLKIKFEDKIDLSLYESADKEALLELFNNLMDVDARRKFVVENNGISLLLAYCIEGIQELNK